MSLAVIERTVGRARIICTDRRGGVSAAPYDSANLADHVGDDPGAVAVNRGRLAAALGPSVPGPSAWVWLRQVHGADVLVVDAHTPPPPSPPGVDAVVTDRPGLPLVVLVADCAPVALVGDHAAGVVHAGWAGLEGGVVEHAVDALRSLDPGPIRAVLGPCIHRGRYEFGPDLLERMVARFGPEVAASTDWGTPSLDVPAAVRAALRRAGVDDLDDLDVCTASSPDHFSYRRDGTTGRQAIVVVRDR